MDDQWRRWFAWYPVLTEKKEWVWLEYVERQEYASYGGGGYHYRDAQ